MFYCILGKFHPMQECWMWSEKSPSHDHKFASMSLTHKHLLLLVHLTQRLKCTIVITCCPSSVRPSVVRRLLFTFSTSPLKPLNRIQRNLIRCKNSTSSTKLVFFGPIGKTRWSPWPLIGWDIFDFSSETTKQNSMKLDRNRDLNFLYQVCVFRADRKNKMAAQAADWLRHFRLLLWNRCMEFNETRQKARSQCPLPSLCFSGRLEKQDGRPGLWLAETFSPSPLKPLNGIQRNLTGSKISMSFTKFVFFRLIGKQDGRLGLWLAETFWPFPLKRLNGIKRNLTGSKISTSSTK